MPAAMSVLSQASIASEPKPQIRAAGGRRERREIQASCVR